MFKDRPFIVKYLTSKNCMCMISSNISRILNGLPIELRYNENSVTFLSCYNFNAHSLMNDEYICIDPLYAKALGIEEHSVVVVSTIPHLNTIQTCTLTAINDDDYSILNLLAQDIQSTLLSNIRVIYNGQKFIIWVGKVIHITVKVYDINPASPGFLDNLTEVVIKPPENEVLDKSSHYYSKAELIKLDMFAKYDKCNKLILRLAPYGELADIIGCVASPFSVFVLRNNFKDTELYRRDILQYPLICSMKLLTNDDIKQVFVRVFAFDDFIDYAPICQEVFPGSIYVSHSVMSYFQCKIGTRILLEYYEGEQPSVSGIEIYTKDIRNLNIKKDFQEYLAEKCKIQSFVLSPDLLFNVGLKFNCFVKLVPREAKFCYVDSSFVRDLCNLSVCEGTLPVKRLTDTHTHSMDKYVIYVSNYEDIVETCKSLLTRKLELFSSTYSVLITGQSGTGKSTLLKMIKNQISEYPYYVYTDTIQCKTLKGKSLESLCKLFISTLFELVHCQPSVLILEDLDVICQSVSENDVLTQNDLYFNRVSEMLRELLELFASYNRLAILGTAESVSRLNTFIYSTRGNYLFRDVHTIKNLSKFDRYTLIDFFFSKLNYYGDLNLDGLAEKTEGFVTQDIAEFVKKARFASLLQGGSEITEEHFGKALEQTVVASFEGVDLQSSDSKNLSDVGGLADIKNYIIEMMQWPTRYDSVFPNSPLRLKSGLLLYGPPGTGKTILVGAAANHCCLKLIVVKGPELLSKYIGESEEAVRRVFRKAQNAKPCLLFFDEFDSLAARRGHDNTGVTDRVVNQILTHLDGIEELSGVFVVAATSRPDLLDPALLRPGRLDIHIRCPLPDEAARMEILEMLSRSMKLANDVNLQEVAEVTEGFTGADIQSILYTVQLESSKHLLDGALSPVQTLPEIHQTQLLEAVKKTKPSLSKAELAKYEQIYKQFESGNPSGDFITGSRTTLA